MRAAGIKTPVPLDELEAHLREEFDRQIQSGANAQQAFAIAVGKIGRAPDLKGEFRKVGAPMEMERIIKLAGIACVAVALFVPAWIGFRSCLHLLFDDRFSLMTRALPLPILIITLAITVLSWKYNHKLLPEIANHGLRRAIGMACFVGCLLWMPLVLFHLPIGATNNVLLLALLFGLEWTVFAILGGIGYGLEKAAHRQATVADF